MAEGLTLDSGIYHIESLVLGGAYATGQGPQQPVRALQDPTQIWEVIVKPNNTGIIRWVLPGEPGPFGWFYPRLGNGEPIILSIPPKEFIFRRVGETPDLYNILAPNPEPGVDFYVGVSQDQILVLKSFLPQDPESRPIWRFRRAN